MITLPGIEPVSEKDREMIWKCGVIAWNTKKKTASMSPNFGATPARFLALLPDDYRLEGVDQGVGERLIKKAVYACTKAVEAIIEADTAACVRVVYEPWPREATIPPFRINIYAWHRSDERTFGYVKDDLDPMAATE